MVAHLSTSSHSKGYLQMDTPDSTTSTITFRHKNEDGTWVKLTFPKPLDGYKICTMCLKTKREYRFVIHTNRCKDCVQEKWPSRGRKGNRSERVSQATRNSRLKDLPRAFTLNDQRRAYAFFNLQCAVCQKPFEGSVGVRDVVFDHWIPVSSELCPGTIPTNMIPLCRQCNNRKRKLMPEEWIELEYEADEAKVILSRIADYFASLQAA